MGRRRLTVAHVGGRDADADMRGRAADPTRGLGQTVTYREAVADGLARELRRDPAVVCLGEDIGAAGGVFKTTPGLFAGCAPGRVDDTPTSEQATLGRAT